ncbi:hypothetical protein TspCOW1_20240 [Thiohalobacter sp. COW1]|uniref:WD40 repeat domain-containing protein n=1 Tax=Thiohalobacter sp. COW1 TaxID=2795687 RepID=UPI00191611C2|nr:hypothetical protein [Thiohalobacter sp. COW1]BCO31921.1 hypothetical protein TspCOW1_20240 [Thiohalobacter sp. COW1]
MRITSNWRALLIPVLSLALAGCMAGVFSSNAGIPATVIHAGVHSGGSALAFNPDETLLASGGWAGRLHLWSLPRGTRRASWQAHAGSINGLAFLRDGAMLVSAGYDGRILVWDLQAGSHRAWHTESPVTSLAVDAARGLLASGHDDGRVTLWRIRDGRSLEREGQRRLHSRRVRGLAWHPVRLELATSGSDGRVMLWRLPGDVVELPPPSTYSRSLAYSRDGRALFGSGWFRLFRWQLEGRTLRELPTAHRGIINSIGFGGEDRYLASISRQTDSAVYFLDPETGAVIKRFQRHELCGGFVAVSPYGRYLATTSDDASVRIWDLRQAPQSAGGRGD